MKLTKADDQLRRESPAYQPDAGWDTLEPQGMNVVVSVRFDARTARHIHAIGRETGRSSSRLVRDWTLERLASLPSEHDSAVVSVREASVSYDAASARYEELRQRYRPEDIDVLLVGESRPAGGTFFYLANSNLYYATHEAFQLALGPMPAADGFLDLLRERRVWLYDLSDTPVDRMRGRPRRAAVQARVSELVDLLRVDRPRLVVAIKKDLEATVRQALQDADLGADRFRVLPFPLYQWRSAYVQGLADLIRAGAAESNAAPRPTGRREDARPARPAASTRLPRAEDLIHGLVGVRLQTLTGVPNRILRVDRGSAIVATNRSPKGKPVSISEVQAALDALSETGDLLVDVPTVGHRSAFIGAVLRTLPGVEATTRPRRIRLVDDVYGSLSMDEPVDEYIEGARGR